MSTTWNKGQLQDRFRSLVFLASVFMGSPAYTLYFSTIKKNKSVKFGKPINVQLANWARFGYQAGTNLLPSQNR